MHAPREDSQPWYRQFWPWFLISIPAGTVVAAMFTINLAVVSSDGLVNDDYYKEGLAIHMDADRVKKAQQLGLSGQLAHERASGRVEVRLNEAAGNVLQLTLFHPTRANRDQQVALQHAGDGRYVGRLAMLEPANWRVSVQPPASDWRISGRLSIADAEQLHGSSELH
jgi:hypothetical protein